MLIFIEKTNFFLEKTIRIENSGFVETCDEHLRREILVTVLESWTLGLKAAAAKLRILTWVRFTLLITSKA